MLSAAISAVTTVALQDYKLDFSSFSDFFVILLIFALLFYLILFIIRLFNGFKKY